MKQAADLAVEGLEGCIHNGLTSTKSTESAVTVPAKSFNLQQLRNAIPPVCFESSLPHSLAYLARDILYAGILVSLALRIDTLPNNFLRVLAWTVYMFAQGCVGTGLWILAHECGHGAFSKYQRINDFIGWVVHSALLVPYFSWKITHARHHRYTGHITKDAVFVPETEDDLKEHNHTRLEKLIDMAEETSIVTVLRLLQHQLMGFQIYLLLNMTSGRQSLPSEGDKSRQPQGASHFMTSSRLFLPSQKILVILSDIGLISTLAALTVAAQYIGYQNVLLLYLGPYLWTHHWLGKLNILLPIFKSRANLFQSLSLTYITHIQTCLITPTRAGRSCKEH